MPCREVSGLQVAGVKLLAIAKNRTKYGSLGMRSSPARPEK